MKMDYSVHYVHTHDVHVHENHNFLGHEWPSGLGVKQPPNAYDAFRPIPGLIGCAGVTGSVGITRHACATQMAGLKCSYSHSLVHVHVAYGSVRLHQLRPHLQSNCRYRSIVTTCMYMLALFPGSPPSTRV